MCGHSPIEEVEEVSCRDLGLVDERNLVYKKRDDDDDDDQIALKHMPHVCATEKVPVDHELFGWLEDFKSDAWLLFWVTAYPTRRERPTERSTPSSLGRKPESRDRCRSPPIQCKQMGGIGEG